MLKFSVDILVCDQCSPLGILAQYAFSTDFALMWKWDRGKSFDVVSGSAQAPPFQYIDLGRTLCDYLILSRTFTSK